MSDPYAELRAASLEVQRRLADIVAARAVDPSQMSMRRQYLGWLNLPPGAKAVEFGSGTGHITRELVEIAGAAEALGIELSPVMVERAREFHGSVRGLRFQEGDAAATDLDAISVDLVVMHTVLCHSPAAAALLGEAERILKPGGQVAIFDGDYHLASVALSRHDPLQAVIDRAVEGLCARPLVATAVWQPLILRGV
jgi:ubiquinone/menaquinone biosynthesis C-methylase UbiE